MVKLKQGKRRTWGASPERNLTPKNDVELIEALDGATALRAALVDMVGQEKVPSLPAVNMWKYRGIAPDWRPTVATLAKQRGITLYENFLAPAVVRKSTVDASE